MLKIFPFGPNRVVEGICMSFFQPDHRLSFRVLYLVLWITPLAGCGTKIMINLPTRQRVEDTTKRTCSYGGKVMIATNGGINVTDSDLNDFSHTITTANGLPSNRVNVILQHNQTLLAGTPNGLVVFKDDCSLTVDRVITTANGLPSNNIGRLYTAPDGALWVMTAAGVARSEDGAKTFTAPLTPSTPGLSADIFNPSEPRSSNGVAFSPSTGTVVIAFFWIICRTDLTISSLNCVESHVIANHWMGSYNSGVIALPNGRFIVSTGYGYLISDDDGVTWTRGTVNPGHMWLNGIHYNEKTGGIFFNTAGWSSYTNDPDVAQLSNFGAGSGGTWGSFTMPNGRVITFTVDAAKGVFVSQSEENLTTTRAYTTTNGLLSNRGFWALYIE
jgi:hypothetical protein